MTERSQAQAGLKKFAEGVLRDAKTFLDAIGNDSDLRDAPPTGPLDPEDWAIMRYHAEKILDAIEADRNVDPAWIEAICKCAQRR